LIEGLAEHYSAFRVSERLFLTGHSHQAWPDVAREGQLEAWQDAAEHADLKWERAFAKAERVRAGVRRLLADPGAPVALAGNTHELVLRFLSALPLRARPKLVTTDGEFHTLRRQLGRLAEDGLEVVRLPARPVETLAERLAAEAPGASAVLVSAVLFEDSRIVPELPALAAACGDADAELLVDAYHALGCLPFTVAGLERTWIVGGGYKYLQLGEGNCFLRLPPQADEQRPAITGWFAEFEELHAAHEPGATEYPRGSMRFAGSTYDPTSHYRAARVLDFFEEQGMTPERLRESYLAQTTLLAGGFDALALDDVTRQRDIPLDAFGGFLALESGRAEELSRRLLDAGVVTDSRGRYLRFGPAPYHSDEQLETAVEQLGRVARS
jgi:kynureninase